jgi:CheY-like chemotaxis protein
MGRRILVVDDNPVVRWTLKIALQSAHYQATCVDNAAEVRSALAGERFDLILMDVDMPGLDGLSAAEQIVDEGWAPGVPILFLTSSDEIANMTRARRLGAYGYLTKHNGCNQIVGKIESFLNSPATTWLDDHTRLISRTGERPGPAQAAVAPPAWRRAGGHG